MSRGDPASATPGLRGLDQDACGWTGERARVTVPKGAPAGQVMDAAPRAEARTHAQRRLESRPVAAGDLFLC